jgi:hypothetical protein
MQVEQRKKLLDMLSDRFSIDELRTLAYVIRGTGAFDDLQGETRTAKAISLLELLEYRDRMGDLLDYVREVRRDINVEELGIALEPERPARVEFVNRVSEIQHIVNRRAPQYQLVDAPAGYGKTELLKEIIRHYQKEGWLCVYAEIPANRSFSLQDVMAAIVGSKDCDAFGEGQLLAGGAGVHRMGFEVAECLLENLKKVQSLSRVRSEGIILLLDSVELLDDTVAGSLLNELLPGIQKGLQGAGVQSPFRAIFAGRHISSRWKELAPFISSSLLLTPFSFSVVKDTVEEYTASVDYTLDSDSVVRVASHLMHITGGHPGCMARILGEFRLVWLEDNYLPEMERHYFQTVVQPVVAEVRKVHVRDALDTLSPCRRYTPKFLRGLIQRGLIQHDDAYQLENELTATYLVTRKHGFLQDDITRRLLAIRLRHEQLAYFVKVCEAAKEIYAEHLADPKTTRPEIVAIELLYQELQLRYYLRMPGTQEERAELADEFFSVLEGCLQMLVAERDAREMIANVIAALEEDWEFQFVINYLLRGETYAEHPFQRLKQGIDQFRRALEKGNNNG